MPSTAPRSRFVNYYYSLQQEYNSSVVSDQEFLINIIYITILIFTISNEYYVHHEIYCIVYVFHTMNKYIDFL